MFDAVWSMTEEDIRKGGRVIYENNISKVMATGVDGAARVSAIVAARDPIWVCKKTSPMKYTAIFLILDK